METGEFHVIHPSVSKQQTLDIYDPIEVVPKRVVILWDPTTEFHYQYIMKVGVVFGCGCVGVCVGVCGCGCVCVCVCLCSGMCMLHLSAIMCHGVGLWLVVFVHKGMCMLLYSPDQL